MRAGQLLGAGAGAVGPTVPLPTDQPLSVSRRELLSRAALLGFGAAAAGAAVLATREAPLQQVSRPTVADPPMVASQVGRTSLQLTAPRVRIDPIGHQPGQLPALDGPFAAHGALNDAAGATIGTFTITPVPGVAGSLQLHTFELDGGALLGMGTVTSRTGTFAIIGGTGRYRGATGTYSARVSADRSGRPATAEFRFDLSGGE
jgi:hypothetical protein